MIGGGHCASVRNTSGNGDGDDENPGYSATDFMGQNRRGGVREIALTMGQMPRHDHDYKIRGGHATADDTVKIIYQVRDTGHDKESGTLNQTSARQGGCAGANCKEYGESYPHNNMPPYAVVLYLIKIKDER